MSFVYVILFQLKIFFLVIRHTAEQPQLQAAIGERNKLALRAPEAQAQGQFRGLQRLEAVFKAPLSVDTVHPHCVATEISATGTTRLPIASTPVPFLCEVAFMESILSLYILLRCIQLQFIKNLFHTTDDLI